jgi:hypothetical protein
MHISSATRYMKLSGANTMTISSSASSRSRAENPALSRYSSELDDVGRIDLAGDSHLEGRRRAVILQCLQLELRAAHVVTPSTRPDSRRTARSNVNVIRVPAAVRTVRTPSARPLIMVSPRPRIRLRWLADESPDH